MPKKYRFFTHYNKLHKKGSIHFRGKCFLVDQVRLVNVPLVESKSRTRQPFYVMQGMAETVHHTTDTLGKVIGTVYG